jgi:hypothetical protein
MIKRRHARIQPRNAVVGLRQAPRIAALRVRRVMREGRCRNAGSSSLPDDRISPTWMGSVPMAAQRLDKSAGDVRQLSLSPDHEFVNSKSNLASSAISRETAAEDTRTQ